MLDGSLKQGGIFPRWLASVIDVFVGLGLLIIGFALMAQGGAGVFVGLLLEVGVVAGWIMMWRTGVTPGKKVMGLRVIRTDGTMPGILTMLLREWPGKYISGAFGGLGWLWALFDKDRQTWHDKMAGTVVVTGTRAAGTVTAA